MSGVGFTESVFTPLNIGVGLFDKRWKICCRFAELDVQPSVPETSGIRIQALGISVEFFPDADCNQIKTVMEVLCHAAK